MPKNSLKIYLRSILLTTAIVLTFFTLQIKVVESFKFEPKMIVLPIILGCVTGLLLGKIRVLRDKLGEQTRLFRAIADFSLEFTFFRKVSGQYEYASPACLKVTGYEPQQFYDTPNFMNRIIHPDDMPLWQNHVHHINERGNPEMLEVRIITPSGEVRWIEHLCSPVYDDHDRQIGVRATNVDITERKAYEQRIEQMANYDPLTGLPNRRLLMRTLESAVTEAQQYNRKFAVMFLDLDRFKYVNDTFGHTLGDRLLKKIAQRLTTEQPSDSGPLFLARFGGDEFVILKHMREDEHILQAANAFLELVDRQFEVGDQHFYISGSIGIAIYPYDGTSPEELIQHADTAMYKAKGEGKNNIQFYSAEQALQVSEFFALEKALKVALERGQFLLHYQPQIDLNNNQLISVEALLRWNHPVRGLVSPLQFIPIAEETRLIIQIGQLVLREACRQWHTWQQQGINVSMAVNVSPIQFQEPSFCDLVESILRETGMSPQFLELEITEGMLMGNAAAAREKLRALKNMGISIAIDDFGTGYSSLEYLKDLPIDKLKIDMSFVCLLGQDAKALAIVKTISALADNLSVETTAEGIETSEQLAALRELGCGLGQGYLFSKPQAAADLEELLQKGRLP